MSWDFVYGTNMQHGFLLARQLLAKQTGTKQIIMITDGEPTAHITPSGDVFFNYPPVPETVEATLREVVRCTTDGIRINTFMLDANSYLKAFIEQLTQINRGRAFFTTPETLGDYVLVDFIEHKRQQSGRGPPGRLTADLGPAGRACALGTGWSRQTGAVEEGEAPSAGGGEDFGELYRANLRPLLGMATALIGSRGQAEEVVQEAFATTFDHYGRLEDPTKALRRSVLRGCASRKPDPDDPTRVTERILGRVRALGRGPRDAVALRYSLGLDAPEIDRTLGLEAGTAAMRLHEAGDRAALRPRGGRRPRPDPGDRVRGDDRRPRAPAGPTG